MDQTGEKRRRSRVWLAGGTSVLVAIVSAAVGGGVRPAVAAPELPVVVRATSAAAARAAVERAGGEVTFNLPIVKGAAARVRADRIAELAAAPGIREVTEDAAVHVQDTVTPSSLHPASAVYPAVVGADRLWGEGTTGTGVAVAVLDTGIARVPDLDGRLVGGIDLSGEGDPFVDSFGHGTFVAGLIAGNGTSSAGAYRGVAPQANLVSIKIAGRDGASDVSHVLAGIQWAVSFRNAYGIRALNLSLGTDSHQPYRLSPLNYAVERAWDSGIVVVVSASNSGPGAGTITKPGDDPLVVTVGAVDDRATATKLDDVMAGFSGQGPTAADGLTKPDLVASGRSVVSLRAPGSKVDEAYPASRVDGAYFRGSGTSFSTAITSGATALLLQREPALTPDQVKARLLSTATAGPAGNPNVDGAGSLDAYAAAHAGTFASANQGVVRSLGTGLLGLDRGSLRLKIQTASTSSLSLTASASPSDWMSLTGESTAQNKRFDDLEYTHSDWNGTRWYQSQWGGSRWYATTWDGTRWYGSRWYENSWYGSRWYAMAWE